MIRTSDCEIIDVLISVRMYESSLTGENIASHILSELDRFDLDRKKWRPAMMDRASTNGKALEDVMRLTSYDPSKNSCLAHTSSLPGE